MCARFRWPNESSLVYSYGPISMSLYVAIPYYSYEPMGLYVAISYYSYRPMRLLLWSYSSRPIPISLFLFTYSICLLLWTYSYESVPMCLFHWWPIPMMAFSDDSLFLWWPVPTAPVWGRSTLWLSSFLRYHWSECTKSHSIAIQTHFCLQAHYSVHISPCNLWLWPATHKIVLSAKIIQTKCSLWQ